MVKANNQAQTDRCGHDAGNRRAHDRGFAMLA